MHLLSNSSLGLPTDLWLPATAAAPPQHARQVALGLARSFADRRYEVSLEGYHKTMRGLIAYREGGSFTNASETDWEEEITRGEGESYGVELLMQKRRGRLSGWLGYTWSRTTHAFAALNEGRPFPARHDRRHDVAVSARYRLTEEMDVSGSWVFSSAEAVTLPESEYVVIDPVSAGAYTRRSDGRRSLIDYGPHHGSRLWPYHRLDLALTRQRETSWGTRAWSFGVYNAYNRLNAYYVSRNHSTVIGGFGGDADDRSLRKVSLFPFLPFARFSFTF